MKKVIDLPEGSGNRTGYKGLSLIDLIKKIVEKDDLLALEEFHNNRSLFHFNNGPPLRFTDFLSELRENIFGKKPMGTDVLEIADYAYDLTLDKFSNLPGKNRTRSSPKRGNDKKKMDKGPDCRLYFRAFLDFAKKSFSANPPQGLIEEEERAAKIMGGLVRRHFYFSRLEAERNNDHFWSRYYWSLKGHKICLWLPVSLKGQKRRKWLEENIDNPDPLRDLERERIQTIINRRLVRESLVPIDEILNTSSWNTGSISDQDPAFGSSLANVISEEKANKIKQQRRSIKSLGRKKLKKLVLRIFDDLCHGEFNDGKVAEDFGLSKTTFSRFAGSRWMKSGSIIPDLWLNTAQVLSTHKDLKGVAIESGVWGQVEAIVKDNTPLRNGGKP